MSQFYSGVKQTLLSWAVNEKPAGVVLRVKAVDDTYVFGADHNESQVTGELWDEVVPGTVTNGIVDLPDFTMNGLTQGKVLKGFVIYFDWPAGNKLICLIDSAADMTLPLVLEELSLQVKWNANGVFKI